MTRTLTRLVAVVRRPIAILASAAVVAAAGLAPAVASSEPIPSDEPMVTADALPTVQIDGVAWDQLVLGDTVYVVGQFTTARPAGSARGQDATARSNALAYNLTTGALITGWAPSLNGPGYALAASADGSKIFIGGDFTTVNGTSRNRFAAVSASSGALDSTWKTGANAAVRTIAANASEVYIGGNFTVVGGQDRPRLASFSASTGALRSWRVSAQSAQVDSVVLSTDGTRLFVGGRFEKLNNVSTIGMGAVSTSSGSLLRWDANKTITNSGYSAGITSMSTDGTYVYGTGFAFNSNGTGYGNLEGAFAADPATGAITWIEDCHGDTYSLYPNPGKNTVYVSGHPHNCGNISGYPEVSPRVNRYALAFTKDPRLVISTNVYTNYYDFGGTPAPALRTFFPDFVKGTFTGQNQATWDVTGNSQYVVYGGEFLQVNGVAQEGLTRFAVGDLATKKQGPRLSGTSVTPAGTSRAAGTVQLSWPANWDRDDPVLTYRVFRNNGSTPVYEVRHSSAYWQLPRMSFIDTGLQTGQTYSYKVQAVDAAGNAVTSPSVNVTVASGGSVGDYASRVLEDNPSAYWRLGESSGSYVNWTGHAAAGVGGGVDRAVAGALSADDDGAARFTGSSSSRVYATARDYGQSSTGPNTFSIEAWFTTTSTTGGQVVGFGSTSGTTDSSTSDRHVYVGDDGRVYFGVNPGARRVISSPGAYADGSWHHVVATLGASGMHLFVDGAEVASNAAVTSARMANGYWRVGGDVLSGWTGTSGSAFVGTIDEVASYGYQLTSADVAAHYSLGTGGVAANQPPTAAFTATGGVFTASFDGSASSDPDGSIAAWAWAFGDGATGSGATTSHDYAAAGTYTVTLTVTDDDGATSTVEHPVTVTEPASEPVTVASDTFERTVSSGLGSADVGGAWTASATTSVASGAAVFPLPSANAILVARLPDASAPSAVTRVTTWFDKRPNGSGVVTLVRGRIISSAGEYRLKTTYRSNGSVVAALVRTNAAGAETVIAATTTVTGLTFNAGTKVRSLLEVSGASPTTVRAKIWADGSAEPTTWLLTATDSTDGLQAAGHVGLAGLALSTTTNSPTVMFDDLTVVQP